jgi:carboxylesterase
MGFTAYRTIVKVMLINPQLDGTPFYWEGGPVGILLIHGFTATTAEVRPLAKVLHSDGYTVAGPLLPGHFTHPRDLNHVRWQDWVSAVGEMYHRLSLQCNQIVLGGESTGALLSLFMANQYPDVKGLLLYGPALRLKLSILDLLSLHALAPFIESMPKNDGDSDMLWQGYPVNPLKGVLQLLSLQKKVSPILPTITQPALIVQGRLDNTVHPAVPDYIYSHINSSIKEIYWLDNSSHCVLLDHDFDQVVAITHRFLNKIPLA